MKKYLLGLFAIVLAVGASSFAVKSANFYYFPVDASTGLVVTSSTISMSQTSPTCSGNADFCERAVPDTDAHIQLNTPSAGQVTITSGYDLSNYDATLKP